VSASQAGAVVVTGLAGRLGRRLARRLHRVRPVIGLDPRVAGDLPSDVEHEASDPLRSGARRLFARGDVKAIVHLGVIHNPQAPRSEYHSQNLRVFRRVVELAETFRIPKLVLLSSANAYGPRADNAQFLTENAPLLAGERFSEMHALVELDMYAQSVFWRSPNLELVIVRPANILGTVRNAPSNYLRLKVVPTLMGFDPMVQIVHQDDVAQAIERALVPGVRGIFNIAGPPPVALSKAVTLLDRKTITVPYSVAKGGLSSLFALRMVSFPAQELDFIRYVCMCDDTLAKNTLGYAPQFDLERTLRAVDAERWAP
jgi:UDP-glucose 4-epimerase